MEDEVKKKKKWKMKLTIKKQKWKMKQSFY